MAWLVARYGTAAVSCLVQPSSKPTEAQALADLRRTGIHVIEGDLMDPAVSAEPPPRISAVFHLAANIDTDAPEAELRVNDLGTERLLTWLGGGLRGLRIVYASSVAVTDRNGPARGPIDESTVCVPRTAYGVTKLRGEQILKDRAARDGYSYTILRLPTVYGPGGKPGGMFDRLMTLAGKGALLGRLNWPGKTSVIYVDDVAAIMLDLALRPEAANELYCVASDESPTVGEIAQRVGKIIDHPVRPIDPPGWVWSALRRLVWSRAASALMPPFARVSYWRFSLIVDDGFWFDTRKLRRVYRGPLIELDEGLRRTMAPHTAPRPALAGLDAAGPARRDGYDPARSGQ